MSAIAYPWVLFLASVAAILFFFWSIDRAVGPQAPLHSASRPRKAVGQVLVLAAAAIGLRWVPWPHLSEGAELRTLALPLVGILTWKAATEDIDVATDQPLWGARLQAVLYGAAVAGSPLALVPWLAVMAQPFGAWKHHGTLPLRVLQLLLAFSLTTLALPLLSLPAPGAATYVFTALVLTASHYVITAFAKARLGPHWYSWMFENKLHHVVASARTWGWARFVPFRAFSRSLAALRRAEVPLQIGTFALEASVPLLLLHPNLALGYAVAFCGFHVIVFATTGILFWEWMVTNAMLAWLVWSLPAAALAPAFGPAAVLLGMALMLLPLTGRLWQLFPLGWWDTPLTQRVQWRVIGESGKVYGLYNDFMCPHERLYGRCHGCFLVPHPVFTYHLGEVWRRELRDGIRELKRNPEGIDELRKKFGIDVSNAAQTQQHQEYLGVFFQRLNAGARKAVLPKSLRWLKAPGGQYYYWGDLLRYRRQEPVQRVQAWYREEYFDGEDYLLLNEGLLMDTQIDSLPGAAIRELDEKAVDGHLMARAAGKLVDAPAWVLANAQPPGRAPHARPASEHAPS